MCLRACRAQSGRCPGTRPSWVRGLLRTGLYLLVIHDAGPDLRGLVARSALHTEGALVEGLPGDAVVGQLDVDVLLDVQRPDQDVVGL